MLVILSVDLLASNLVNYDSIFFQEVSEVTGEGETGTEACGELHS